jgi:metal-dependent amidase/aminoacylase/carboxypeptidase family protein
MLEEGVFEKTKPDAVFGMHVMPGPAGSQLSKRPHARE